MRISIWRSPTDGLQISPETNLIESGLLDSLAFVDLTQVIPIGFGFAHANQRIEASARIVWRENSKNRLGLRFVDLPETSRQQIKELLSLVAIGDGQQVDIPTRPEVTEP